MCALNFDAFYDHSARAEADLVSDQLRRNGIEPLAQQYVICRRGEIRCRLDERAI